MKYIDADLLRKEIERRYAYQKEMYNKTKPDGRPNDGWAESLAIMGELEELRTFLDSLQREQPNEHYTKRNALFDKCVANCDPKVMQEVSDKVDEMARNDLEKAADDHIRKVADAAGHPGWDWTTQDIAEAFIAGAKWQYQKDRREFAKLKAKEWMSGYDAALSRFVKIPYEPRDWFSSGDGDFICGASFDEAIPAKVELYYRTKSEENESKN